MRRWVAAGARVGALASATLCAQTLEIYSEFQRVDPFGNVVPVDRASRPREILSPAVARNAHASFHLVVSVPPHTNYLLYIATNPLDACRVTLYKEHFVKAADGWIPDPLVELRRLPDFGAMPDPDDYIPEQNTRVYLLDLWIPPDATPGRFRLEAQLRVGAWIVRPMEVRVLAARVPDLPATQEAGGSKLLPGVDQRADASAVGPLRNYASSGPDLKPTLPLTVRDIIRRNAIQDVTLARSLDPKAAGPEVIKARWTALSGTKDWGAEWYLRLRDFLYQEAARLVR